MLLRNFTKDDYELLTEWWHNWKWPAMPLEALSDTGLCISALDGEPLAIGFVYLTNSTIAWVEWITASPHIDKRERAAAVRFLLDELCDLAKDRGKKVLFSSLNPEKTPGLLAKYQERGFIVTDEKMTNVIARIE